MQLIINDLKKLGKKSAPIKNPESMVKFGRDLLDFMRQDKDDNGRQKAAGMAAIQVGKAKRVFVMEVNGIPRICINPKILSTGKYTETKPESCLSFPNKVANVDRWLTIFVEYYCGINREVVQHRLIRFEARVWQHEFDHLNGKDIVGGLV